MVANYKDRLHKNNRNIRSDCYVEKTSPREFAELFVGRVAEYIRTWRN